MGSRTIEQEIAKRVLRPEQFSLVRAVQRRTQQSLITVMLDMELVDEEKLAQILHQRLNLTRFEPEHAPIESEALYVIEDNFAVDHSCLPVGFARGHLLLAMVNPLDAETQENVSRMSGYPVEPLVATRTEIRRARDRIVRDVDAALGVQGGAAVPRHLTLATPAIMFFGHPDGVGKTFLMWNLAHLLRKQHRVLLVEIGLPDEEDHEKALGDRVVSPYHYQGVDSDLIYVPDPCMLPDAVQELAEQSERQNQPGFDLVFAELGEGAIGLRECQIAKWAGILLLVTEAEYVGESWELIREIIRETSTNEQVSIGVVFNKTDSTEHGEAGFAALEAAARSAKRKDAFKLWYAGAIPFEPSTMAMSEHDGKVVVDAFPRGRISREIRAISKRVLQELTERGLLL